MLPNLDEIDLSNLGALDSDPLRNVAPHCRHLQCIRWTGPQGVFGLGGIDYLTVGTELLELYTALTTLGGQPSQVTVILQKDRIRFI